MDCAPELVLASTDHSNPINPMKDKLIKHKTALIVTGCGVLFVLLSQKWFWWHFWTMHDIGKTYAE